MNSDLKKTLKQIWRNGRHFREQRVSSATYPARVCDTNAGIRARLDATQVEGQVGVITQGMDCDCTSYRYERVGEGFSCVAAFKKWDDERTEWLDGPESVWLVKPEEIEPEESFSRDLALEAFEDGHPHVIYA